MPSRRVIIFALVIFCSGMVLGAVATRAYMANRLVEHMAEQQPQIHEVVLRVLSHRAELTDAQTEALRPLVLELFGQLVGLQQTITPKRQQLVDAFAKRAEQVLPPSAAARLHTAIGQLRARQEAYVEGILRANQ